ncbi:MAG: radical SAM family heme chaperone HemW [Clostridia bacterium]|nr:radical SAM family heme chaperone HemW [Clostridia bacterium]
MNKIGLYIHIPFCKSKCPYCDFYSLRKGKKDYESYVSSVKRSLKMWAERTEKKADTLYLGGGTPSLLGGELISEIVLAAKESFGCNGEITVECNPSCIETDFFKRVVDAGVNRVSLGMQSAVDSERKKLGRLADVKAVERAINRAFLSGIENVSVDLMIGIPDQNEKTLAQSLEFCAQSGVKHISAYMLKVEEGTFFHENPHKFNFPDEDLTADLYLQMVNFLETEGYSQYEISNFAQQEYESRHNLKYWNCEEYLGIGPAAHSFLNGKRFYYPRDIQFFENGEEPVSDGDGGDLQEYIMLKLRLKDGLIFEECKKRFSDFSETEYIQKAEPMLKAGFMKLDDKSLAITTRGFLISNSIIEKIVY